ncbi:MAG: MATE family efflux transporter [Chitinophagales bacterium]|nr:MAG: MATE family efflux transporter [Chitinophagales bacterium]
MVMSTSAAPSLSAYLSKMQETLRLAIPIIAGQVGMILMGFFDTVQIGGLGHEYIAGSGFGHNVFWLINLFGIGILFSVSTLVSEAKGENQEWKAIAIYQSGMHIALILSGVFMVVTVACMQFIDVFRQAQVVNDIALRYLWVLLPSILFMYVFTVCKQFVDGLGRTTVGMYITLAGLVVNVFLNWVLIYGNLGMPRLEVHGAALATTITRAFMMSAFLAYISFDRSIGLLGKEAARQQHRLEKKSYVRPVLKLGIPSGLQFFFEVAAFQIAHFMSGWIGVRELSAHGIAIGLASITFMILGGLSAAGSILTGYAYGARNRNEIKMAGTTVFVMTIFVELVFALIFIVFRDRLPLLYTRDTEVIMLASNMILLAAFFQVSDGLQAAAVGALRGIQDVKIPMCIALVSYWGIMIPACYLLAFRWEMGLTGIWVGFIFGLSAAALLLLTRFWYMVSRVRFEEV